MRYLKTENDYLQYLEEIDGKIINSASFPFGSVYFRVSNGTKLTFFLGSSNEPYKKEIFNLDFPISFNGEFYQNYADAEEVLGELFGSPSKELKDKVEEIEDNLNTALTNLENNTEDIEVLQDQMEQKADLSEVYTQERVDLLLNLKVDNSTLQNQYYNKDTTDAKLALKSDKADTYNKTDVDNLLNQKASKDEVDLLETEVDSINDDLLLKANKADVYTKAQTDNLLADKANIDSVYNKSEVDIKLDEKADKLVSYTRDEINDLLDEKANYETIQGIEGSINNIYDALSNHQSQLDNKANANDVYTKQETNGLLNEKADKEWTETEISSLWSSNSNHQVQLDSKANANEVYTKSETNELLNQKANVEDLSLKADKTQIEDLDNNISQVEQEVNTLIEDVTTKASKDDVYTKSQTDYLLGNKQDTLVNQQNIKSVQNQTLLGDGNIELFSMMNQADYDAMVEMGEVNNSKLYLIPDNKRVYFQGTLIIDGSATPTPTPEPTGTLCMTLSSDGEDTNIYQNDGENIKEALDRYLGDTFGYDGDYDEQHCNEFKSSITHVAFSNNITQIESTNVGLFGYGSDAGYGTYDGGWNNIVSVTLPSNLQTIGNNVFQIMPKVNQWNIPSTVTSIGEAAFERRSQDPNVNRVIRFNSNSCPSLSNSSFDIVDEEQMVVADTNQTFKVNCGCLSDYSSTFTNMGGSYEVYSANGLITEDCDEPEPEPTEGKLVMTLYKGAPNDEGTVAYEVYQNDGETIKQALDRFLTDRFDDDTSMNNFKDSITHIVFDNSVTEISGDYMFSYSSQSNLYDAHWRNVESITLPNNLITIGSKTFADMPKVSYWNIPSTVQRVSSLAFLRINTNPNVFREIRFNTYGCDPPTFELYNKWSVFDIENEETIDVDTNQKITCERNEECREEFTEYFNQLGSNYAEYVTNGVLQPDECM